MQYLHLCQDIRQGTGKNNLINFVHSFYMTYVLFCILASIYAINQQKESAIKIEGHKKDEELIFKSSHRRQTNLQGNVGRFLLGGGEWEHEKYHTTKIMGKKQKHTYIWMALGNRQGPLCRSSIWGTRCLRAFKSDHPAMRYHSLSTSKASTMIIKGKQELGHTDKSTKIALKTQELGD